MPGRDDRLLAPTRWTAAGFLGTTVFTTLLLLATLLHWDRFNHDHVSFWAWLALYVATPVVALQVAERRAAAPGVVSP